MRIKFNVKQAYFEFDGGKISLSRLLPYGFMQTFISKLILEVFGEDFHSLPAEQQLEELYKFVYGDRENWSKEVEMNFDVIVSFIRASLQDEEGKLLSVDDYVPKDFVVKRKAKRHSNRENLKEAKRQETRKEIAEIEVVEEKVSPSPSSSQLKDEKEKKVEKNEKKPFKKVEEMLSDINRVADLDF